MPKTRLALATLLTAASAATAHADPALQACVAPVALEDAEAETPPTEIAGDVDLRVNLSRESAGMGMVLGFNSQSRPARVGDQLMDALLSPDDVGEPLWDHSLQLSGGIEHRITPRVSVTLQGGVASSRSLSRVGPAGRVALSWSF